MGVILLFLFYFTSLWVPKSFAEEYKFCEAKPLGKYCLSDNSGWRECVIDYLDEPAEELHYCPADSKYVWFFMSSFSYLPIYLYFLQLRSFICLRTRYLMFQ